MNPNDLIPLETSIAKFDAMLAAASLQVITSRIEPKYTQLRAWFTEKYGYVHPELLALGGRIRRKKKDYKKHQGTVPASKSLIGDGELMTRELLLFNPEDEYTLLAQDDKLKETTAGELAAESSGALQSPEAGYILDAFYKYFAALWDDTPLPIELESGSFALTQEGDYYVLKDTFDSFCKNAGVDGEMRRRVKAALFPQEDKAGLLEYIRLFGQRDGKKICIEKRFISRRTTVKVKNERKNRLPNAPEYEPEAFILDIDAELFSYIAKREDIFKGKGAGKVGAGWLSIPAALNMKIDRAIRSLLLNEKENPGSLPGAKELQRNPERFRGAVQHLIRKWEARRGKATSDMIIENAELVEKGLLGKHVKDPARRIRDMRALGLLCSDFWLQKEAFSDCKDIEIRSNGVIIFKI